MEAWVRELELKLQPKAQSESHSRSREVNPALAIDHAWGPDIPESQKAELLSIISSALQVIEGAAPSTDNLFRWSANRNVLAHKRFQLHITTSNDPAWSKLLNRGDNATPREADAASIMVLSDDAKFDIVTALFVDKLFFNKDGSERPDGFAQTIVALAHEIYGNVQHNLELDPAEYLDRRMHPREELEIEIRAYKAAGEFGERLKESEIYSHLSEGTRDALDRGFGREREVMVGLGELAQRDLNQ
jgi:hypothetical protein